MNLFVKTFVSIQFNWVRRQNKTISYLLFANVPDLRRFEWQGCMRQKAVFEENEFEVSQTYIKSQE